MTFYVFCGTFIFSMIFVMFYFVFVDRPFHSLTLFKHDLATVTANLNMGTRGVSNILNFKKMAEGDRVFYEDNNGYNGEKSPQEKSATLFDLSDRGFNSNYLPKTQ